MCDALNNSIDIEILEEKYKLIFENAKAGINIYEELPDGNRKLIECNQRYVEMSGYSREELMECKNTTNLQVNLETLEQYLKNDENRSKGKPYNGIFSWIRPDGKENYIEYTAYSFQRGNRTFTVGIDHDITEQKEIERLINMQRDIALCLNSADNFNEAIDFCIKIILNTSKMDHGLVYLYNEKMGSFELVFPLEVPEESVKTIYYFDRSVPAFEVVMQGRSIYDLNNAVDLISEKYRALMVKNNINTLAIIPIKHKDTVIGCIVIASHSKIEINTRLRKALEMVSVQIGNAIIRLKAEESLRKSEARFRTIIENSSDAVELIEADGTVIYSSPATSKISGYSLDELVGRNVFTVMDSDNRELLEELKNELFQNKKRTIKFEMRSRRKDGEWVWVEGTITNMLDAPNIGAIVTNYRDVTDRKIAENALKESEEKYRLVVENGNDAIVVAQDGRIKFANRKCQEITGYSEEELKSRPFTEFIFPEDREMVLENHIKRLRGEKIPNVYLFRIVRKDEDIIWVEINGVVINWEGRPATLNFMRDVTEKKRMEEDILRMQKLESVGILAGGIAHDFNNILTGILGNISLAKINIDPEHESYGRLTEAEKATYQAKNLTQQLLTFSSGGSPILKTTLINDLLIESVNFILSGSKVRAEFYISDDLNPVNIDKGQINQVINNVILNAGQAMPNGGIIKVYAENVSLKEGLISNLKPGNYVKISIQDNGIGIPKEHLPKIFDPYFTTKQKGSGLGLTISYAIIKKHNGHIEVESELGKGTTFHIYLPVSTEQAPIEKEEEEQDIIYGEGNILIMDDEKLIRELVQFLLIKIGYKTEVASHGEEAIELYKRSIETGKPFDAVIMDLTIPGGMGGEETIKKLLEIDPKVKAIVSSGYSNDPIMADYAKYGFSGVIAKPYKIKELSKVLHDIINSI